MKTDFKTFPNNSWYGLEARLEHALEALNELERFNRVMLWGDQAQAASKAARLIETETRELVDSFKDARSKK